MSGWLAMAYTASLMLASAAPVLAQGLDDGLRPAPAAEKLPLEPDTRFDAVRWYDEWWDTSVKGMANIPSEFVKDMKTTYSTMKSIFNNGVKVGNVLIIRGGPDTARILKYHAEQMGIHYRDTIKMFPEHVVKAGGHFAKAGKHIGKVASENARHTAEVAADSSRKIVDTAEQTVRTMGDVGKWMGRSYEKIGKETWGDLQTHAAETRDNASWAVDWTGDSVSDAFHDTIRWMKDYQEADLALTKRLGEWTKRQAPEGWNDTVRWTTDAANATGRWTRKAADWTATETSAAVSRAGENISDAASNTVKLTRNTAEGVEDVRRRMDGAVNDAAVWTAEQTFGRIPGVVKDEAKATAEHARWLWKKGYEEGLKGGFELAGDNYFAGDIEGIAVGTFYSVAAVAQGVGYVLVLEPLAFTGHVGLGVTKTVGLAAAGAVGTAGVAVGGKAAVVGTAIGGAALTVGVAALGGAYTAGTTVVEGLRVAGTATAGGLATAGAAIGGGLLTAGAATVGTVRTVGGVAVGGLATYTVGTAGLIAGEAAILGAGTVRMAGTAVAGTAMTAGALALGGLKMTGDVALGTVKMVGVTALGAGAELLVPAIGATMTAGYALKIAGTAITDNAIITPAVATWDILTALTLGGWELVRDPALGTYHLVAGVTGFSYRLVGLTSAMAVTAVAGTLYAVAKAPISLVFYGGMWSIAAGGKLIDTIIAPFKFGTQNHWKNERKPQLEDILGRQEASVRGEIGEDVTYIRVVFSGEDRGKVNFFTTEKDGKKFKFQRKVRGNCLVVYRSGDTPIVLDSGQYDRKCMERSGK